MILFLLLQSAAPDIELNIRARARSVTIEQKGDTRLSVTTDPDGGNVVDVQAPKADGRKTLNNVNARVRAEGRIAAPSQAEASATSSPQ